LKSRSRRQPALLRAEDVTRTPDLEIFLRDPKAVAGFLHNLEPLPALQALGLADQHAVGRMLTPPDAAPQLMQLRQPETLGVLDQHDGGIGHIDPDLDHRRGQQDLDFSGAKIGHHLLFFVAL
jgi:hypothetical protein